MPINSTNIFSKTQQPIFRNRIDGAKKTSLGGVLRKRQNWATSEFSR